MNRRIALALILTLLAQAFLPDAAFALRDGSGAAHTIVICTGDGLKEVALDPGAADPATRAQQCCPCGLPCAACGLPGIARTGVRVVYGEPVAFLLQEEAVAPVTGQAPPGPHPRAPPSSS